MSVTPVESAPTLDVRQQVASPPTRRFKPISLSMLIGKFICSRGLLCLSAVAVAVLLRMCIDKPFRWFEWTSALLLLLAWPRLELWAHHQMHHATGTMLYKRHQLHHHDPLSDTALGDWRLYLGYNLFPLGWFVIDWAWALTLTATFLAAVAAYEFVHFSTHFRYRPWTRWGHRVRRNHLLHHRDPSNYMEVVFPRKEE